MSLHRTLRQSVIGSKDPENIVEELQSSSLIPSLASVLPDPRESWSAQEGKDRAFITALPDFFKGFTGRSETSTFIAPVSIFNVVI